MYRMWSGGVVWCWLSVWRVMALVEYVECVVLVEVRVLVVLYGV